MTRATQSSAWNVQDHIGSAEQQIGYLEAAFEDGDPALIAAAIADIAHARGAADITRQSGISRETLSKDFAGNRDPTLASVIAVLKSLDLRLRVAERTG